ncbi:MAG: glycosyltransferase family 2 protein [Dehalococcoidia bacterium]|nr:glycosyltransferase family 2 protein [Dehalococcoidia bacterium]MDD5493714.1 glycosyltransferase family 2 protein [Dehalococcoidia bacterium]
MALKENKTNNTYIIAVIPCFNEENFIGDIIRKTRQYVDHVVVVDDGSTDRTFEIAVSAGADVIRHKKQMGAGAGTMEAFEYARKTNADILVTLDGDAQHNPDEIPNLLKPIINNEADMVVGSRFLKEAKIRAYRKFGIDVITRSVNLGSKVKFSDSQCSFRAHNRKILESVYISDNSFGYSVEVLIQARKIGARIAETPVSCIYHDQGSTLNPILHGFSVLMSVIKHRIRLRA